MINIAIKSEIDSRVVLYPLMRCLVPLGNILVVTSNKQVSRLIDGDYAGDFRNFHILVDTDGATDELLEESGISAEEYTYVVYDNVGVVDRDKLIIPIGPIVSEEFESEMLYLGEDKNTHIIRFGKSIKGKGSIKDKASMPTRTKKQELSLDEEDAAVTSKFKPKKEDVQAKIKKLPNMTFPSFDSIELFESDKKFFQIDRNFIKLFYAMFQEYIGIKEHIYAKEVSTKDESSNSISHKHASGENSIVIDAK